MQTCVFHVNAQIVYKRDITNSYLKKPQMPEKSVFEAVKTKSSRSVPLGKLYRSDEVQLFFVHHC